MLRKPAASQATSSQLQSSSQHQNENEAFTSVAAQMPPRRQTAVQISATSASSSSSAQSGTAGAGGGLSFSLQTQALHQVTAAPSSIQPSSTTNININTATSLNCSRTQNNAYTASTIPQNNQLTTTTDEDNNKKAPPSMHEVLNFQQISNATALTSFGIMTTKFYSQQSTIDSIYKNATIGSTTNHTNNRAGGSNSNNSSGNGVIITPASALGMHPFLPLPSASNINISNNGSLKFTTANPQSQQQQQQTSFPVGILFPNKNNGKIKRVRTTSSYTQEFPSNPKNTHNNKYNNNTNNTLLSHPSGLGLNSAPHNNDIMNSDFKTESSPAVNKASCLRKFKQMKISIDSSQECEANNHLLLVSNSGGNINSKNSGNIVHSHVLGRQATAINPSSVVTRLSKSFLAAVTASDKPYISSTATSSGQNTTTSSQSNDRNSRIRNTFTSSVNAAGVTSTSSTAAAAVSVDENPRESHLQYYYTSGNYQNQGQAGSATATTVTPLIGSAIEFQQYKQRAASSVGGETSNPRRHVSPEITKVLLLPNNNNNKRETFIQSTLRNNVIRKHISPQPIRENMYSDFQPNRGSRKAKSTLRQESVQRQRRSIAGDSQQQSSGIWRIDPVQQQPLIQHSSSSKENQRVCKENIMFIPSTASSIAPTPPANASSSYYKQNLSMYQVIKDPRSRSTASSAASTYDRTTTTTTTTTTQSNQQTFSDRSLASQLKQSQQQNSAATNARNSSPKSNSNTQISQQVLHFSTTAAINRSAQDAKQLQFYEIQPKVSSNPVPLIGNLMSSTQSTQAAAAAAANPNAIMTRNQLNGRQIEQSFDKRRANSIRRTRAVTELSTTTTEHVSERIPSSLGGNQFMLSTQKQQNPEQQQSTSSQSHQQQLVQSHNQKNNSNLKQSQHLPEKQDKILVNQQQSQQYKQNQFIKQVISNSIPLNRSGCMTPKKYIRKQPRETQPVIVVGGLTTDSNPNTEENIEEQLAGEEIIAEPGVFSVVVVLEKAQPTTQNRFPSPAGTVNTTNTPTKQRKQSQHGKYSNSPASTPGLESPKKKRIASTSTQHGEKTNVNNNITVVSHGRRNSELQQFQYTRQQMNPTPSSPTVQPLQLSNQQQQQTQQLQQAKIENAIVTPIEIYKQIPNHHHHNLSGSNENDTMQSRPAFASGSQTSTNIGVSGQGSIAVVQSHLTNFLAGVTTTKAIATAANKVTVIDPEEIDSSEKSLINVEKQLAHDESMTNMVSVDRNDHRGENVDHLRVSSMEQTFFEYFSTNQIQIKYPLNSALEQENKQSTVKNNSQGGQQDQDDNNNEDVVSKNTKKMSSISDNGIAIDFTFSVAEDDDYYSQCEGDAAGMDKLSSGEQLHSKRSHYSNMMEEPLDSQRTNFDFKVHKNIEKEKRGLFEQFEGTPILPVESQRKRNTTNAIRLSLPHRNSLVNQSIRYNE